MRILKHPFEYFHAQVVFADKMSRLENRSFKDATLKYTDLYSSITHKSFGIDEEKGIYNSTWIDFINRANQIPSELFSISQYAYSIFQNHPESFIEISKTNQRGRDNFGRIFGSFSIDYGEWNRSRQQIRLHFRPQRLGLLETIKDKKLGDLVSANIQTRRSEFREMIKFIKNNPSKFPDAKYFVSSTWLQNIPNYQTLFPPKYREDKNREIKLDSFLGLWGQFEKWDLKGNTENLERFVSNLNNSENTEQAIKAFPYPVYKITIPLEEMFEYYEV